ncbi:MAG: AAA family ATPase [Coriobacteriales bacterium]|nr:AAA family ATPase [Coriobacteriales bacterium]
MGDFDAIIGYDDIKQELERTADILRNSQIYKVAGAKLPSGLLLYGEPGVGKTLMATCFIQASELPVFTVRKDRFDGAFVDFIRKNFEDAKAAAPSIVFLDDLDKFANEDAGHKNAPEYVAVQAGIDAIKGCDVFVLATANELSNLPDSLKRAGRFDKLMRVDVPRGQEGAQIIHHYLADKPLASDISFDDIALLMDQSSCAKLESIINEARLLALYKRKDEIGRDEFMEAFLKSEFEGRIPFGALAAGDEVDEDKRFQIAVHEAGHAAIYLLLTDGPSITFASAFHRRDQRGGCCYCRKPDGCSDALWSHTRILGGLGGRAAVDLVFGMVDPGSNDDLSRVCSMIRDRVMYEGRNGLNVLRNLAPGPQGVSQDLHQKQETLIAAELQRFYQQTKQVLASNREFLLTLAQALMDHDYLLASDIEAIKKSTHISSAIICDAIVGF